MTRTQTTWSATKAARQMVGWTAATSCWLESDFAVAFLGELHKQEARTWWASAHPLEPYIDDMTAIRHCYAEVYALEVNTEHEYLATKELLADRAHRVATASMQVASPAATATIVAAAEALTSVTATTRGGASFSGEHLLLSFPLIVRYEADHVDDIIAVTGWRTESGGRTCNWLSTRGPVQVEAFDKAMRFAAAAGSSQLPPLFPNADRAMVAADVQSSAVGSGPSEGSYGRDWHLEDPAGNLTERILVAMESLMSAGILTVGTESVMCAKGVVPTDGKRVAVQTLKLSGNEGADHQMGYDGAGIRMGVEQAGAGLRWSNAEVVYRDEPID